MGPYATPEPLELDDLTRRELARLASSPHVPEPKVVRACVLLAFADGMKVAAVARRYQIHRTRVIRIVRQAQEMGVFTSLEERRGSMRWSRKSATSGDLVLA